jgi:hypothetical protein
MSYSDVEFNGGKDCDRNYFVPDMFKDFLTHPSLLMKRKDININHSHLQCVNCTEPTLDSKLSYKGPGFDPRSGHMGFVVDKVALGQVFFEYFGFPCQFSFHRLLHTHHLSSGAGIISQIVADVPSRLSLTPNGQPRNNGSDQCFLCGPFR